MEESSKKPDNFDYYHYWDSQKRIYEDRKTHLVLTEIPLFVGRVILYASAGFTLFALLNGLHGLTQEEKRLQEQRQNITHINY